MRHKIGAVAVAGLAEMGWGGAGCLHFSRKPGLHRGAVSCGSRGESGSGLQTCRVMASFPHPLSFPHTAAESLAPGESATAIMGINFCDSTQVANFQLWYVSISWWDLRARVQMSWSRREAGVHPDLVGQAIPSAPVLAHSPTASKPVSKVGGEGGTLASLPLPPSPPTLPSTQTRQFYVSIQPPVGELMAPVFMSENEFKKEQGECPLAWVGQGHSSIHGLN